MTKRKKGSKDDEYVLVPLTRDISEEEAAVLTAICQVCVAARPDVDPSVLIKMAVSTLDDEDEDRWQKLGKALSQMTANTTRGSLQ